MPRRRDTYDEQFNRGGFPPPNMPSGKKVLYREEDPFAPPPPPTPPGPTNKPAGTTQADPQGTGGYYQQYGQQDVLGTDLQSVLGGRYDVGALQKEYGDIFADYDPTREQFAQQGLAFGQEAAGIGYGRQLGQYERQAELLGSQLGEEGYLAQAMGRQMGQLGLSREAAESGAAFQTGELGRQGERLGLSREAAESGAAFQTGALGRQREQLGLQRGAAEESAAFQTGELGRQRAGTQRGISETYTGGRQGLMAMREQAGQAAGRGGFAGSGAAQTQSERARQAYIGQLGGGVANLRDRLTGIGAKEQMVQSGLERQMAGFDIQGQGLGAREQQIQSDLSRQMAEFDIQGRGIGAREQQIESDLSRQMKGFDIQGKGIEAGFGEATQRAQSQLTGIQSEIGEGGFLSQAYQNQLGQLGLGFQEDVYGLRDIYGEKQRDRLLDLINSGADLDRFRTGANDSGTPTPPGGNQTDRDIIGDMSWDYNYGNDNYEDYAEGGTGPAYDAWLAEQQRQGNTTQYGNQNQEEYSPNIQPQKDISDMNTGGTRGARG